MRFSGFRSEVYLQNPEKGVIIDDLKRSGRRYQLCYNLKTVVLKSLDPKDPVAGLWKIRQAAVHHQLDIGSGTQLWIFGDPHAAMKDIIREVVNDQRNHRNKFETIPASFKSSLDVHLGIARWSTEGWRQHILSLEETIDNLVWTSALKGIIISNKRYRLPNLSLWATVRDQGLTTRISSSCKSMKTKRTRR